MIQLRTPIRAVAAAALAAVMGGCGGSPEFPELAREFVFTSLAFSPSSATQAGLHRQVDTQTRDTLLLDARLDDFSPASLDRQRAFYSGFQTRLQGLHRGRLDPQAQADYDLLTNAAAFSLFTLTEERFTTQKPQLYAETLGNALFSNISLEYADTATRAAHLASRLEQVPSFIATAMGNLQASNEVWRRVALEEMEGVADMVRGLGADFVKGTPAESRYGAAQPGALAALEHYTKFVRDSLAALPQVDWRMGPARFATKWRYYLQASFGPEEMLRAAEDSMGAVRREMLALSRPLHDQWFPAHRHSGLDTTAALNTIVGEVLTRLGQEHTQRDSLVVQARKDADSIGQLLRTRRVVSQTDVPNLKIIPTPVFMRGVYAVAGAVFAPALEPGLATFFWVTPIPPEWPAKKADAKLREYNRYKMLTLTVHEALPGHVLQGAYANRVTPEWRRLLRAVFGSGTYIEGWAVYAEDVMEGLGLNGGDSTKARLTALKAKLRLYANAIIDTRLHTKAMPGDSAVVLMVRDAFQEEPEAVAKLQRAQLDYVQLNLYAVGLHEWWRLRREAERRGGGTFNLCRFHDTVLSYGPVPVPVVGQLYFEGVAPTADMPPSRCDEPT